MKETEKEVWVLTNSNSLGQNIGEFLSMDGITTRLFDNINLLKSSINGSIPKAFILDELNNNGAYSDLINFLNQKHRKAKIIILNNDGDKSNYSLASDCLGLPVSIEDITDAIK